MTKTTQTTKTSRSSSSIRTSHNDPLRVDFIASDVLGLPGRIGLTIAPGKKDRHRQWDRDLAVDLTRLASDYGAALLVSLMEEAEYTMLGIPDLLARAEAAGIATRWFPIRDVAAPTAKDMDRARQVVAEIVARAWLGETVVIHCRGGIGRSGLIAAACLVELGHAPRKAIELVRQARPGAVEVAAQERWVDDYAAALRPRTTAPSLEVVRGCLLGGALGDALGAPIEFASLASAVRDHGMTPPATLTYAGGQAGEITDDTQMTLFVAEGVIRASSAATTGSMEGPALHTIAMALLRWYETQSGVPAPTTSARGWLVAERRLHARRAPGNTCMGALSGLSRAPHHLPSPERPPNHSKGCGAVMRSAPIGLAAPSREEAFALARDAAAVTHGHPSGFLSAAYFAALIWDVARGAALPEAMSHADRLLSAEPGNGELLTLIARTRRLATTGAPTPEAIESLGGGWTGEEALAIALLCALTFDPSADGGFQQALWRAVLHSGDSDSTGSLTGNLIGAMGGTARLPAAWLDALELRDVIERVAGALHAVSQRPS